MTPRGKLMLTDHGSEVWFRNFELRSLHKAAAGLSSSPVETTSKP